MTDYITKKEKPKYITKKAPKKEETESPKVWITKKSKTSGYITKEKPKYITKKAPKKEWITKKSKGQTPEKDFPSQSEMYKKQRAVDPTVGSEQRAKNAGGGRAPHGYGRAYMKGGRVK